MTEQREIVAAAYAGYYHYLGADGWDDMEGSDRQRCREVADVVIAAQHGVLLDQIKELHAKAERLREALEYLIGVHHVTRINSKLHDAEHQDWRECPALTCKGAREALES